MRYAIFSDIHGHPPALSQVLTHARQQGVGAYLCLGDVGGDSSISLVRNVAAETIFGNWELTGWRHLAPSNQQWALNLPPMRKYPTFWATHAAPLWPDNISTLEAYLKVRHRLGFNTLFPYYTTPTDELWQGFSALLEAEIPVLFHGHTHQQVAWVFGEDNRVQKVVKPKLTLMPETTYIVGVGSVGLPRDSQRPSYVIFDTDLREITFVRV